MWDNRETTHVETRLMSTNTLFRRPSSGPEEPLPPSLHGHVTPPPRRGCADQSEGASNKASCYIENWGKQKKRSPLRVILQSLYEEHAVSLVLFLWCGAAPVPGSDLKRLNSRLNFPPPSQKKRMSAGRVNTKLHDWSQARNTRDWEHFPPAHARESGADLLLARPQEWFSLCRNDQQL